MLRRTLALVATPLLLTLLMGAAPRPAAQTADQAFGNIAQAIAKNNEDALARYFGTRVRVTLNQRDQDYAAEQARFVVREFFTKNPANSVDGFNVVFRGGSADRPYMIGDYSSSRGQYVINVFLTVQNGAFRINHLLIRAN